MSTRLPAVAVLLMLWSQAAAQPAKAAQPGRIVQGTLTSAYPSTGALLVVDGNEQITCSGVMIGCETFLTAAHCVCPQGKAPCQGDDAPDPFDVNVYLDNAGFFPADVVIVHPDYDFPVADVAVVKLLFAPTSIPPSTLATMSTPLGTPGTIVGFGTSGGNDDATGLKRFGSVVTAACPNDVSETTSVCWKFTGVGSNSCAGDSGGPLFLADGSVAGTTSGGTKSNCLANDSSYDANVPYYHDWIAEQAGDDLANTVCGDLPQIGQPGSTVTAFTGELDRDATEAFHTVVVPENTEELRIGMHGTDDGRADFDLSARFDAPPTDDDFDCDDSFPGQYAYCEVFYPDPGTWHVRVKRVAGEGAYQLSVTTLGGSTTECGNDVREDGEECDGVDSAGCAGGCDPFDCVCLPCADALSVEQIQLARKFVLRGTLANDDGTYDGFDPSGVDLTLALSDAAGNATQVVIPAGDPGWKGNKTGKTWHWRGRIDGLRRLTLRDRAKKRPAWTVVADGRDVTGASTIGTSGLTITLRSDYTCALKRY
jgi:hypothetical protein